MSYVVRSKNTGLFLVIRRKEATWTGTKSSELVGWTADVNEASDLYALLYYRPSDELRAVLDNADSEKVQAEFTVTTVVTLKETQ